MVYIRTTAVDVNGTVKIKESLIFSSFFFDLRAWEGEKAKLCWDIVGSR